VRKVLIIVALSALGGAGLLVRHFRQTTIRPGKVRFELRDGWGRKWTEPTVIWISDVGMGNESTDFELAAGDRHISIRPAPSPALNCGTTTPFEGGTFVLHVEGEPTDAEQRYQVRLGPSATSELSQAVNDRIERFEKTRTVRVTALLPDGGPAASAWVTCDQDFVVANESGVASCGKRIGEVQIAAGKDGWGAVTTIGEAEDHRVVALAVPSMQLHVVSRGPAPPTGGAPLTDRYHFVVRSKAFGRDEYPTTPEAFVAAVPLTRTIVCLQYPQGACEIVVPPPSGGVVEVGLEAGEPGAIEFVAKTSLGPVPVPIVYLDRSRRPEVQGPTVRLPVSPGRHVLVLNLHDSPERYEAIVEVEARKTTQLGELVLETPRVPP